MSFDMKRVILDVDVGTDDAFALLVLLYAEKLGLVKIEAIICTMGNTSVENVCKNVVRLLEIFRRTDIPVHKGAKEVLIPPERYLGFFHGADGFGDIIHETEPNLRIIQEKSGAEALRDVVINNPGEISLVCVGPLTNAALAMKIFQDFAPNLKEIFIMGGNYAAIGNATETAEFNFFMDPESAHIVLDCAKCPITITTWETCLDSRITFGWRFDVLGAIDSPFIQLLNKAERSIYKNNPLDEIWQPCDAFLVIAMLFPKESILRQSKHNATVELHGSKTRGQIVLDHLKQKETNLTVIEKINDKFAKEILLKAAKSM